MVKLNRKAIAYLVISLAIMGIIAANMGIFANRFRKVESSNIEVINNEFVGATLTDMTGPGMDKFMDVASKKALQHLSVKLVEGNIYESVENAFDSLMLDGFLNETIQYRYPTLNEFLGATTNYYHVLGFSITKVSINSTFSQISPWSIIIDSRIRFKVSVPRTKYSGFFDLNTVKEVSLLGIEDPIGGFKITNKWKHNESYPSFIDRLNGDAGAESEYGICRDCEGEAFWDWGRQVTDCIDNWKDCEYLGKDVDVDVNGIVESYDSNIIMYDRLVRFGSGIWVGGCNEANEWCEKGDVDHDVDVDTTDVFIVNSQRGKNTANGADSWCEEATKPGEC